MARSKGSTAEAGYISARPTHHLLRKPLATHGRSIHLGQMRTYAPTPFEVRFVPKAEIARADRPFEDWVAGAALSVDIPLRAWGPNWHETRARTFLRPRLSGLQILLDLDRG